MINDIEERWREFYLPYTFGELHSQQTKPIVVSPSLLDGSRLSDGMDKTADTLDNPLEEELYIQQYPKGHKHKYTTEEI